MYVAKVKVDNVRGFHDARRVDLDLARRDHDSYAGWTVLVGPNGSGKTTLLKAIALALAGPAGAQALMPATTHWVSSGKEHGGVELDLVLEEPSEEIYVGLTFDAQGVSGESDADQPRPWLELGFCAAYGPYRHLGAGTAAASSRLAGLFREDLSLSEGVSWLIGQHLRAREKRPGAADVVADALAILGDGPVPVTHVDAEGLWAGSVPLREMGDGARTVVGLVVDLLRHIHAGFGELPASRAPGVVLIDEIDAHLHPSWQQSIGDWLKRHFPRVQFLVSTNSPYVCQSADPAGVIHLPAPEEQRAPYVVEGDLLRRVLFGSGEDIVLSGLFGLDSPYSARARRLRRELVDLELKVLDGRADDVQLARYRELQELLVSSPLTRSRELDALLQKEKARRGAK